MSRCIARRWGCRDRGGVQPPLAVTTSTGQTSRLHRLRFPRSGMTRSPACHATAFAARSGCPAPVSAPSGGAVSSAGDGAARDRAPPLLTHGPCPSVASLRDAQRVGRAPRLRAAQRSRPAGPTATPGRNRCRAPGSRARHSTLDTRHSVRAAGPLGPGCRDPGYSVGRFQSPPRAATSPTDAASRRPRMLSAVIRFVSIAVRAVSTSRYPAVPLRY